MFLYIIPAGAACARHIEGYQCLCRISARKGTYVQLVPETVNRMPIRRPGQKISNRLIIFPKEVRELPGKLSASDWDLKVPRVTTGGLVLPMPSLYYTRRFRSNHVIHMSTYKYILLGVYICFRNSSRVP